MPEIAGDAALFVNPFKPEEITNMMIKLNSDHELRAELSAKGQIHSQNYSWNKTAQDLWNSIEKVLLKC